jgi:hypothetical protein
MRKTLATYALAGALGLSGVAGAALVAPAVSYAATGDSAALDARVSTLKDALQGLVSDGTITQEQADKVASTLAEAAPLHGRGGLGRHLPLEAAAEALGMTVEELRTAAAAGTTLAELAEQKGVTEQVLVDAMVDAVEERLAEAVAAGRLTQEHADEHAAQARTRITSALDEPLRAGGHGKRHGFRGGPAAGEQPDGEA